MLIDIEKIKVSDRIRKDFGDDENKTSINAVYQELKKKSNEVGAINIKT